MIGLKKPTFRISRNKSCMTQRTTADLPLLLSAAVMYKFLAMVISFNRMGSNEEALTSRQNKPRPDKLPVPRETQTQKAECMPHIKKIKKSLPQIRAYRSSNCNCFSIQLIVQTIKIRKTTNPARKQQPNKNRPGNKCPAGTVDTTVSPHKSRWDA